MGHHKLMLDEDLKEEFSLLAIHCSEESYKMAYLLNKHLGLQLEREKMDLEFSNKGLVATFPLFRYENEFQYTSYYLAANKCKLAIANDSGVGDLFELEPAEKMKTTFLLAEYSKVDFFLKIQSDFSTIPLRKIIASINEIKQVISSYEIANEKIKSKNNLIFD